MCRLLLIPLLTMTIVAHAADISDQAIGDAVANEIRLDPFAHVQSLNVKTGKGIVTLSGTVNNLLAQERAVRIAQTVRGVRAVLDHIRVEPQPTRSDQEIREDVAKALKSDAATDAYETRGVAIIRGLLIGLCELYGNPVPRNSRPGDPRFASTRPSL